MCILFISAQGPFHNIRKDIPKAPKHNKTCRANVTHVYKYYSKGAILLSRERKRHRIRTIPALILREYQFGYSI